MNKHVVQMSGLWYMTAIFSSVETDKKRDAGSKTALSVPNRYMGMVARERLDWISNKIVF